MTQTIYDVMKDAGYKFNRYTGEVGIEIETESKSRYDIPQLSYWNGGGDGSLRDFGVEYVLKAPIARTEIDEALDEWDKKVNKKFKLVPDSNSTSVHVHLNFLNNQWVELWNFITSMTLVENLFIRVAGDERRSNLFCLPLCDAEAGLEAILQTIRGIGNLQFKKISLPAETYKYAATNVCPLTRFGSIEIRSLRGVTDIRVIKRWISAIIAVKDYSCKKRLTPVDIISAYEKEGVDLVYEIFGASSDIIAEIPNKKELLDKNLHYAAKIATASVLKDNWGFPKPKKLYKAHLKTDLDKIAQSQFHANFDDLHLAGRMVVEEKLLRAMNLTLNQVVFAQGDQ